MDGPEKRKKIKLMKQKLTDIFLVLENVKKRMQCKSGRNRESFAVEEMRKGMLLVFHYLKIKQV